MNFNDLHRLYFIGIGGIGMSALARFFHGRGKAVSGYDRTETALTQTLQREGIDVHYDDDPSQIPQDVDLVVWTPAVPADHRELSWLRNSGIPMMKRAQVLGLISRNLRTIAVAGTHGKTTTSTLAAHFLRSGGIDATAFLGGISLNLHNNFVEGASDWVVAEADEYDRSFHQLYPDIAILNSIDPDHLDIYGTPEAVVEAYEQFVRQIKPGGVLLYRHGLPLSALADELRASGRRVFTFGVGEGDFQANRVRMEAGMMAFELDFPHTGASSPARLHYPGHHNLCNATAAAAAAFLAGAPLTALSAAMETFAGVHRRFEYVVRRPDIVYVDDYAHHPAELEATIAAARALWPEKRLTGIFQPHLYSRTRDFALEFARALDRLDECVLLPIYPAREQAIPGVASDMILAKMDLAHKAVIPKEELLTVLKNKEIQVLLTMGAGDIDQLVQPIATLLAERNSPEKTA